jgi:hypothetical protein
MPGARCTRSLVCASCSKKHTSKRVHRNRPAFPHAMVLTVSFALSSVTGLFCHRRLRTCGVSAPGWADTTSANLTPASGRQDHTTSPYAATSLVRVLLIAHGFKRTRPAITSRAKRCRVHRIPRRVRDDRDTPPLCGRDGRKEATDLGWRSTAEGRGRLARRANHITRASRHRPA